LQHWRHGRDLDATCRDGKEGAKGELMSINPRLRFPDLAMFPVVVLVTCGHPNRRSPLIHYIWGLLASSAAMCKVKS